MSQFPSTMWTVIEEARRGVPDALERFVLGYRAPVLAYLRRRGFAAEAEDLAQEIFIRFLMDGVLSRVDPRKGRFRHLLLAVTRHVAGHHVERGMAKKRGAGQVEALGAREIAAREEDPDFDEEWMSHLLERALARLAKDNTRYHDVLRLSVEGLIHEEIGGRLGLSWGQVKDALHRAKKKLAGFVQEEIRAYSTSEADFSSEIESLGRYLPR